MKTLKKIYNLLNVIGLFISKKLSWVFITIFYFTFFGFFAVIYKLVQSKNENLFWQKESTSENKNDYYFQS